MITKQIMMTQEIFTLQTLPIKNDREYEQLPNTAGYSFHLGGSVLMVAKGFTIITLIMRSLSLMKRAISKQYFLLAILLFNVMISSAVFSTESKSMDCIAYWQLRSVGLSRDYGIVSAKLSDQYHHRYQTELDLLKQDHAPKILVKGVFSAMTIMLEKIDNDYERTAELDAVYNNACPLGN